MNIYCLSDHRWHPNSWVYSVPVTSNSLDIYYPNPYNPLCKSNNYPQFTNDKTWSSQTLRNLSEVTEPVSSRGQNSGPFDLHAGACKALCNFALTCPGNSMGLHPPFLFTTLWSITTTSVSFLALEHPRPISTLGPLNVFSPLLWRLFPKFLHGCLLRVIQILPPHRGILWRSYVMQLTIKTAP